MKKRKTKQTWIVLRPTRIDLLEDILTEAKALRADDRHRVNGLYENYDEAYIAAIALLRENVLQALGYRIHKPTLLSE